MSDTILALKDVSISFGGIKAVQGVSFEIKRGEILGLIGPNGSGKSTCVNLISGVYPLDSGEIYFDGNLLSNKMKVHERSLLGIGRTFQTPKPYGHMTVRDNILATALIRDSFKVANEKTDKVLEMTGLASVANMLSVKLPIEKRKWLDLARVIVTGAKLIMMDEVIAGLNTTEMYDSLKLVKKINEQGITILFIEHVMKAVADVCDRVVVLESGKVLAEGDPMTVLKQPDVLKAYIGEEDDDA